MMTTLRILKMAIASAFLLAVIAEDIGAAPDSPQLGNFEDFQVELCDKPCANNGRCIAFDSNNDGVLDPQCFCNTTFEGDLCETPNTCSLACENGGVCSMGNAWWLTEDKDSFEFFKELLFVCTLGGEANRCPLDDMQERCDCPPGTNGQLCENTCDLTCENGGECSFSGTGQRCRCPDSFYGDQCENECSMGCLNNGVCFGYSDGSGGFEEQCLCPVGFEGDLCETVTPCPLSCENDGVCKFVGSWLFEGDWFNYENWEAIIERCTYRDLPISECLIFQDEVTRPYCECPPNTIGNTCELVCDLDCQNGSSCQFYGRSKICSCETGFAGDLCQFECTKGCVNGACNANATAQWCQCSPYHEGDLCETERACEKTCFNDGKCEFLDEFRGYNEKYLEECIYQNFNNCPRPEDFQRCTCSNGFVGSDCSQSCPCQNGGTCRNWYNRKLEQVEKDDLFNGNYYNENEEYIDDAFGYENEEEDDAGYFCQCPFGFYGRDCQFKYDSENCALDCENGGYCQADFNWNDDDPNYSNGNSNNNNQNQNYYNYYPNGEEIQNGRQSNNQDNSTPSTERPFEYCICPSGFIGRSCETEIDACGNQCKNGGICSTDTTSTQGVGNRALQSSPGSATAVPTFAPVRMPFGAPTVAPLPSSCSCPEGYSGAFCERKACGSGYCSHGGTCVELPSGQTTSAGDDYVCDCSTSILEETVGIGRNCDSIVSANCPWMNTKLNPNEPWACAGYGKCYKEESPTSTPECYCGTEMYTGPRCEFDITDPKDVAWSECNLQCSNDGICLKGAVKPIAEIFIPFIEGTKKSGLFDYETPEFEYCYCPDGFFGVQCDKQYDICGNRDHICFHGSKCKNDGGEWGCDCEGTESAGLYCQYKATDDCGDSNLETFCANEATCTLDSSSNAVCLCSEGWEGSKCETEVKLASTSGGEGEWSSASVAGRLVSMLTIAVFSIALVIL